MLRTGEPELLSEVSDEWLQAIATDSEQLELLRSLGLRSNLIVPLVARTRTIGALDDRDRRVRTNVWSL